MALQSKWLGSFISINLEILLEYPLGTNAFFNLPRKFSFYAFVNENTIGGHFPFSKFQRPQHIFIACKFPQASRWSLALPH